jgi:cytochrome P450
LVDTASSAGQGVGSLQETFDAEPWRFVERVRAAGDIVWDEELNAWLVTSYELMRQIGRDDETLWARRPEDVDEMFRQREWLERFGMTEDERLQFQRYGATKNLFASRGEDHRRQHRWWMQVFSGRTLSHMGETFVRPVAHAEIDRFIARGRSELAAEYAGRVAPRVISAVMGLPWEDDAWVERIIALQRDRATLISARYAAPHAERDAVIGAKGQAAVRELSEMVRPFVEERRDGKGDDFISLVWRDAEAMFGPGYDINDVIGTVATGWAGGSGTTADSTTGGLYLLLTQPHLQNQLREGDEGLIRRFVEEVLRLQGSQTLRVRIANDDAELQGIQIKKGDHVIGLMHGGNRDPDHYDAPSKVDLDRRAPHDHFGFGLQSPQACPGQGLARQEMQILFEVLLERLKNIRFDQERERPQPRGSFLRRWTPLHAVFEPAS